jgi:5-methylcytosine-specific restriction endonuclease McrA
MARLTGPDAPTRADVIVRDGYACRRCRGGFRLSIHHRRPRGMGGTADPVTNDPDNLVLLCGDCHDWAESYREEALRTGWLLRQVDDPRLCPLPPIGDPA